jgi:hypothetical protein
VAQGAARRALDILRHYDEKYPLGSFSPEANAIRVEALLKLGRRPEARAIAAQLVAEHQGSLLAKKVADLLGPDPSTPSP